jgi:tRNA-dihydrouridine synthase B
LPRSSARTAGPPEDHYALYGDYTGVRTARKHVGWYLAGVPGGDAFRARMLTIEDSGQQLDAVATYFDILGLTLDRLPTDRGTASGETIEDVLEIAE